MLFLLKIIILNNSKIFGIKMIKLMIKILNNNNYKIKIPMKISPPIKNPVKYKISFKPMILN
jgi:hypothetical protein